MFRPVLLGKKAALTFLTFIRDTFFTPITINKYNNINVLILAMRTT